MALLTILHVAAAVHAVTGAGPLVRVVQAGVGGLILLLGLVLPGIRRNWLMGIRTPWTLASERVWTRTHQVGGRLFAVTGVMLVVTAFLVPEAALMAVMLTAVVAVSLVAAVYSWTIRDTGSASPRR
ncbi:SdpI family protein [Nonomuraea bangladeshensis]|uniref:SdpI family protein n=1 Tax=Nonomuraea bangladeshensis TaxID=404385 RepID=UPI0031DC2161